MTFCVLKFGVDEEHSIEAVLERLSTVLTHRLRETDEIGWASTSEIAAVLPYTLPGDAHWLGEAICDQIPDELPRPTVEVMVYSADRPGDDTPPRDPLENFDKGTGEFERANRVERAAPPRDSGAQGSCGMESLFASATPPWKRAMDIGIASVALFLVSPLMVVIAIGVKLMSTGPVIFKQPRTGLGGSVFEIYKFRTMALNAEADQARLISQSEQDGPAFKMQFDPRVTRIGRFLRKTSLDELPQLWNVIKGDMSLVGPRPLPCRETNACAGWQRRRLDVTPGITCIWQTQGRSRVTFDQWMRMDIDYIETRSLWRDITLLFQTVWAIASCRGAQ